MPLVMVFADDFPYIRYINSKNGVDRRYSLSGEIFGTVLYGTMVEVRERSDFEDIIDGIRKADYWYKCRGGGGADYWVWGGYLSATIPEGVPAFIGKWNTDNSTRRYWEFNYDKVLFGGEKVNYQGTWTLSDDKLTIKVWPLLDEYIKELYISITQEITVTVANRDKIIFDFPDGTREVLTRNNNLR